MLIAVLYLFLSPRVGALIYNISCEPLRVSACVTIYIVKKSYEFNVIVSLDVVKATYPIMLSKLRCNHFIGLG